MSEETRLIQGTVTIRENVRSHVVEIMTTIMIIDTIREALNDRAQETGIADIISVVAHSSDLHRCVSTLFNIIESGGGYSTEEASLIWDEVQKTYGASIGAVSPDE